MVDAGQLRSLECSDASAAMGDSSLRRWWLLLLVGPTIGAILGLAFYNQNHHTAQYTAVATVAITDPTSLSLLSDSYSLSLELENPVPLRYYRAPEVAVAINSGSNASESAAVESVMLAAAKLADYAKGVTESIG